MTHAEFLNLLEQQIEEQLKQAISVFQNLPEDLLIQPGPNQGWSIAECLEHLNSYAEYYIPKIKKAMDKAPLLNEPLAFRHSFLGRYFIKSMDPDLSAKKHKAMKKHRPVRIDNSYSTVSRFIQSLEELLTLVRDAEQKNWMKSSVSTSISPWIKIHTGDALMFVLTHNRRHLEQAMRIVTANTTH